MTKNTNIKTMEINVEVAEKTWIKKEIPLGDCVFTMATDTAFEILTAFDNAGKTHFAVYMTLLKHRNTTTNRCFPSIETIAKETVSGIRTVKRVIDELEEKGYLKINSGMRGIANNYYFPKEWFYEYFKDDYLQKNAQRHKRPLQSNRKVSAEKQLEKEKEKSAKQEKEIELLKQKQEQESAKYQEKIDSLTAKLVAMENKNINLSKVKEEKFDNDDEEDEQESETDFEVINYTSNINSYYDNFEEDII